MSHRCGWLSPQRRHRPDAGGTSAAVLVGRNRGEGAEGPGGERAAARSPGGRGHLAGPPRPPLRLPRPGPPGRRGRAGLPGPGPVRRPARRRLPAGTCRDQRAPGQAGPAGAGDLARTRAHPGDLRPGPGGRRPVRGHAGRRAPAGHPAAARHRRTGGPGGRHRPQPRRRPLPIPAPGAAIPPGRRSWPAWPRAARSGPPGRRCPVRNGPPRSPSSPPPPLPRHTAAATIRPPRAAACSSSCRTPATWTASTRP